MSSQKSSLKQNPGDSVFKKVNLLNLGCSKNQVDSEALLGEFKTAGYGIVSEQEDSDVIVINTCGFIESAKEESINEILAAVQNKGAHQKVVVAGCLSQRYLEDLKLEIPEVDFMVGTYKPGQILQGLNIATPETDLCESGTFKNRVLLGDDKHHAYVKIAEGCNRTCSFCAIPSMRGKQRSRTIADIIDEVNALTEQGVQEISLIGQDLSFYGREKGGPGETLEMLLNGLVNHTDVPWIRLMYAYPAFLNNGLLDLMAKEDRICNYLDMPIQHASDKMLKLMRRGHTQASLRTLLTKLRQKVPNIALRTTLLLGFPGETKDDFEQLMELIQDVKFDRLGCFTFSEEEGTHSFDLKEKRVPLEVAEKRAKDLMDVQRLISMERNESLIGTTQRVLIDSVAEGSEYHFYARTQWDAPEVDNRVQILEGNADVGTFREVKIVAASEYDLDAILL